VRLEFPAVDGEGYLLASFNLAVAREPAIGHAATRGIGNASETI
jgi:hypothetical protein